MRSRRFQMNQEGCPQSYPMYMGLRFGQCHDPYNRASPLEEYTRGYRLPACLTVRHIFENYFEYNDICRHKQRIKKDFK